MKRSGALKSTLTHGVADANGAMTWIFILALSQQLINPHSAPSIDVPTQLLRVHDHFPEHLAFLEILVGGAKILQRECAI